MKNLFMKRIFIICALVFVSLGSIQAMKKKTALADEKRVKSALKLYNKKLMSLEILKKRVGPLMKQYPVLAAKYKLTEVLGQLPPGPQQQQQQQQERLEEERIAAEKLAREEQERLAKEEQKKLKEQKRLAQEQAEKRKKQDRLAKEKAEQERLDQLEKARLAREKEQEEQRLEQEKAAREEQEKLAREEQEKAERERLAKEKEQEQFDKMVKEFNDLVDKAKADIVSKRDALRKQKTTQDFVKVVKAGMGFKQAAKEIKESYDAIDQTKFSKEQKTDLKRKFSLKEAEIAVLKSNYMASLLESLAGQFDGLEKALLEKVRLAQADPKITERVNSFVDSVNQIMNGAYSAEGKIEQTNKETANVLRQAKAVAEKMASIAPVIRKAYNADLISDDQLSKVIGNIDEERREFVDGYNKNIVAGERLTLEPLAKGLSAEFAGLIDEQLKDLSGSIQGIEKDLEKVIGFRVAFKKIEKGFGGRIVGLTGEEKKGLTKEFSKAKKDIAELKVGYVTKLLTSLDQEWRDKVEPTEDDLVEWVNKVKKIVVDKAFYGEDKDVFLPEEEFELVEDEKTRKLVAAANNMNLAIIARVGIVKDENKKREVTRLRSNFRNAYNRNIEGHDI